VPAPGSPPDALLRAMPALFVLIWSTGFVVARLAMPHAPPLGFLTLRFACSLAVFLLWVRCSRAEWPRERVQWLHLAVCGVLIQAGYLAGVWMAVRLGLGAGLVALIAGLQPLLTALWTSAGASAARGGGPASAPGRAGVSPRQWVGLLLGFAGLVLVVEHKLALGFAQPLSIGLAVFALLAITAGTLYQKRWVAPCDVRTANTVQLLAALLVTAPLALLLEDAPYTWNAELVGALVWSVLGLTLGGSSLLYVLIQRGAATTVTSLLYLVPPCTAVMAWVMFREPLTPPVLAGFALAAAGVALVVRAPRKSR
jgi:drug/metabolite transporter (DMT)-like permease